VLGAGVARSHGSHIHMVVCPLPDPPAHAPGPPCAPQRTIAQLNPPSRHGSPFVTIPPSSSHGSAAATYSVFPGTRSCCYQAAGGSWLRLREVQMVSLDATEMTLWGMQCLRASQTVLTPYVLPVQ
jgi:hypothetical protein